MKPVVEGLLFLVGEEGIDVKSMSKIIGISENEVVDYLRELFKDYQKSDRGITIKNLGGMFKLTTKSEHKEYYSKLTEIKEVKKLSQSALETLAIIAYNEPITRHEIDELRGVGSAQIIRNLVAKDFIIEVGKSDKIGRPILYGITREFLDYFGLDSKDRLPKIEDININDEEVDLYNSKYKEEIEQL